MTIDDMLRSAIDDAQAEFGKVEVAGTVLMARAASAPPRPAYLTYKFRPDIDAFKGFPTVKKSGSRSRAAEMKFVVESRDRLVAHHANQWLAVEGGTIIASGPSLSEVTTVARSKGIPSPFVYFVEKNPAALGL